MKVKEEFERWAVYNLGQDFDCLLDESCHFPHADTELKLGSLEDESVKHVDCSVFGQICKIESD